MDQVVSQRVHDTPPSAYVLVSTLAGAEKITLESIRQIEGIERIEEVYGIFDIVVATTPGISKDEIGRITKTLRKIETVKSTVTMLVTTK